MRVPPPAVVPSARTRAPFTHAALAVAALALGACADRSSDATASAWTLTEELRIGTMEEGPASFGWVKGIAVDGQGRIWVYDHSAQEIRVFDRGGAHWKNVGRKGAGPGELANAEGIAFAPDGRLWMRDAGNSRISTFDGEGNYLDGWTMKFCSSQGLWAPVMQQDRILDVDCVVKDGRAEGQAVLAYRYDRSGIDTIAAVPECGTREQAEAATWITRHQNGTSYRSIPWAPRAASTLGASGETWCAPNTARFEILRLVPGATDTLRLTHAVAPVPVTQADKDSVIAGIEEKGPTGLDFSRIPVTKPAIDRLTLDDQGRLWVRHTEADGAIAFVIFSPEGRLVATARLGNHESPYWTPFVVRGDALYLVIIDHEGVPNVSRFAIRRALEP